MHGNERLTKSTRLFSTTCALFLAAAIVPAALAHGDASSQHPDGHGDDEQDLEYMDSYFAFPEHAGLMYAHIAIMVLAWMLVLPPAVMLSLARSQYTLPAQSVFLSSNAVGVVLAIIYNANTPDLYPNNAHHKIGWMITAVAAAEVVIGLVGRVSSAVCGQQSEEPDREEQVFDRVTTNDSIQRSPYFSGDRIFYDSALGSGSNIESMQSCSDGEARLSMSSSHKEHDEGGDDPEDTLIPLATSKIRLTSKAGLCRLPSLRIRKPLAISRQIIVRIILPFGFVALTTGFATYGRLFVYCHPLP